MDTRYVASVLFVSFLAGCHMHGYPGQWNHGPTAPPAAAAQPASTEAAPAATQDPATETPQTVDDVAEPAAVHVPSDDTAEIAGTYSVQGTDQDGIHYDGKAVISRLSGNMYQGTWKLGKTSWQALIFRDRNLLSCGTAPKHDLGVMAYLANGNRLDGIWFEEQHVTTGIERLIKGPNVGDDHVGGYAIELGETPEKKKYRGNVFITRWANGVYGVVWKFQGGGSLRGVGLRSWKLPGVTQDILTFGFNDQGDATALQFVVEQGGMHLRGHYAIPSKNGAPNWGVETLQRM